MHVRSFATTVAIPTCIFGWISFFSEVVRNCRLVLLCIYSTVKKS